MPEGTTPVHDRPDHVLELSNAELREIQRALALRWIAIEGAIGEVDAGTVEVSHAMATEYRESHAMVRTLLAGASARIVDFERGHTMKERPHAHRH